ncbi:23.2 kDa heat shock protein precursor [Oryza sativa Japonica Group]|jgi:HSP20 family protein|uniref:23.2 kDa heat shock protein n=3 Tax=Oryza TaxID=4527 RepID=HS232_ORYSJ|nr:23.2 kDa heat shock protein precursor [Oryza sativa Japonica Group]Q7XUW5.2 RecName: Full=23.2 kDa heat shock protein; Short=OsHsp23.2; Flags: Precursor [Oryza sativa Japonica Group]ABY66168.1 HM700 protein [Oryza sativa Indica Group]KAB8095467.1 hypothetical protein EE612_023560 [Oryza sativa]EAY94281.1 hypothetical protein OsI_16051 [Oryza sativa Indica Group]EAZ30866.1 hypothetical protein OsJ_14939 [Oryza sativa Japonica Group]KAF2934186.1 hypothetical protein DAI22_04g143900 [Oryza sa|eukprot:NP_001052899.1 Os04g0445100 [Oryza sativa Japonica Group]
MASMRTAAAAAMLACIAVVLASTAADGALLPWFGGGGARDEAVPELGLLAAADPFRILEHVPFGFDRDDVAMLSMARVDWRETGDAHEVVVDVPGMRKEDLRVEVEDNRVLRISGERRREETTEQKGGGDHWHREERSYGRFWRQLRLPDNADLDSIAASLDNGVLTVRFRKLAPDQIKGPRVVGIASAGGDDGGKKSIGGAGEGQNQQAKKVEL